MAPAQVTSTTQLLAAVNAESMANADDIRSSIDKTSTENMPEDQDNDSSAGSGLGAGAIIGICAAAVVVVAAVGLVAWRVHQERSKQKMMNDAGIESSSCTSSASASAMVVF